ncbi:hypothetical protein FAGKG844_100120 [Frankia sp. AgKG'84/4]
MLPEVVHLPAGTPGAGPLADTVRLLAGELAEPGPATGSSMSCSSMCCGPGCRSRRPGRQPPGRVP